MLSSSVAVATSSEAEEERPLPSGTSETTAASKAHDPPGSIGSIPKTTPRT